MTRAGSLFSITADHMLTATISKTATANVAAAACVVASCTRCGANTPRQIAFAAAIKRILCSAPYFEGGVNSASVIGGFTVYDEFMVRE